jgi:hypothetical protein
MMMNCRVFLTKKSSGQKFLTLCGLWELLRKVDIDDTEEWLQSVNWASSKTDMDIPNATAKQKGEKESWKDESKEGQSSVHQS